MSPEDEVQLFRHLEPRGLDLWPEFIDRGYTAPKLKAQHATELTFDGYYFALGEVEAHQQKRGKNKGQMKIDEILSNVIHFQRSVRDENGDLRSGHFWVELEPAGDISRSGGKPAAFHRVVKDLTDYLKARYRRSDPPGFYVGPGAARLSAAGVPLREEGRKGELYLPFK